MPSTKGFIRLAAVGDLHYGKGSRGQLQPLMNAVARTEADILLLPNAARRPGHEQQLVVDQDVPHLGLAIPQHHPRWTLDRERAAGDERFRQQARCRSLNE